MQKDCRWTGRGMWQGLLRQGFGAIALSALTALALGVPSQAASVVGSSSVDEHRAEPLVLTSRPDPNFIRPPFECPTNIEPLTTLLLRDVPDYGNRVSQRSRRSVNDIAPQSHILTASPANIALLPPRGDDTLPTAEELEANGLVPVFFTTLERQYLQNAALLLEHYHWAFLAQTDEGWRLAFMYSRLNDYPANGPATPPRNTSQGVVAGAIRLWLRDCKAGAVDPLEEPVEPLAEDAL